MAIAISNPVCYHCGDSCGHSPILSQGHSFCCDGCKTVYELLSENGMCAYYDINKNPGITLKAPSLGEQHAYLDDPSTAQRLIRFSDGTIHRLQFHLPHMHCSSCVWLLEHLYKLNPGISESRVDFLRKEINITYQPELTTLRQVVELLVSIGYTPSLHFHDLEQAPDKKHQRKRVIRIAVAGFCFGNIMLLSFPDYFHIGASANQNMMHLFSWLNVALSLPVLIYSGGEFFISAWKGLRAKFLNIDLPLALSIGITFGRSLYEIISQTGAGYLDSMSGIIFFMLIGRYFQEKTQDHLEFDRNFKSYFPIAFSIRKDGKESSVTLDKIEVGDELIIRSQEIIPADAILTRGTAWIDYSFVTGESQPIRIETGQTIYAGGRQTGGVIELQAVKKVNQSYLSSLWNKENEGQKFKEEHSFIHRLARNFTIFLILLSVGAYFYWLPTDPTRGMHALTTVLIVACPCALLLSSTFANGAALRIFSRNKFYLRSALVIEALAKVSHLTFDKTGTITIGDHRSIRFEGTPLSDEELNFVYSLVKQSNHPLSKLLSEHFSQQTLLPVAEFSEIKGAGLKGNINDQTVLLGSAAFLGIANHIEGTVIHIEINGTYRGAFLFRNAYRQGLRELIQRLKRNFHMNVTSGDNASEKSTIQELFGLETPVFFSQKPEDKQALISSLQQQGFQVAMIGDGLNDGAALIQSNVGIAVSDDTNNFSPACDAILEGRSIQHLDQLFAFARSTRRIIIASFIISLLYNVVGLSYAVQGELSPVIAAILMPISSITIILFTSGMGTLAARKIGLK